jgi:hypothetical protein
MRFLRNQQSGDRGPHRTVDSIGLGLRAAGVPLGKGAGPAFAQRSLERTWGGFLREALPRPRSERRTAARREITPAPPPDIRCERRVSGVWGLAE